MSKVQEILLNDARAVMENSVASSAGTHPLDDVFAYWLAPGCIDREVVLAAMSKAAVATGAQRTYQEVAILGYATQITDLVGEYAASLNTGLELVSGREPIVGGVPMGFVVDGVAMLGLAIGAARSNSAGCTKDKIAAWIERCRIALGATAVPDWQRTLIFAAAKMCGCAVTGESAMELDGFDVRVMLRAKGILETDDNAEADELRLIATLRSQGSDSLPRTRAAMRLFCLNYIRTKTPTVALNRLTVSDVGDILRRIGPALRKWTWEDKPRTTRKGAEARKWHVENEYHVQNLLWLILAPLFPDLQDEEYTPKVGTLQPRADIPIPSLRLIVEVKFWRAEASSQEMIRQIAQDNSLYLVDGSRYDKIIAFIWDNAGRSEQHDLLIQGFLQLGHVVDAVIVSRPSMMIALDRNTDEAGTDGENVGKKDSNANG
jgi:hypothetical protein